MKKIIVAMAVLMLSCMAANGQAFLRNLGERAKNIVENKVTSSVDNAVSNAVDKAAEKAENKLKGKKGKEEAAEEKESEAVKEVEKVEEEVKETPKEATKPQKQIKTSYAKTDFVPGDEIFFDDPVENERLGEFPLHWDFISGEECEVVELNGEQAIKLSGWHSEICPLMKEEDYLPEEFTIEFDVWSNDKGGSSGNDYLDFILFNDGYEMVKVSLNPAYNEDPGYGNMNVEYDYVKPSGDDGHGSADGSLLTPIIQPNSWLKVQASFNKRAFKYYVNGVRMVNLPNVARPTRMKLRSVSNCDEKDRFYLKNIRIAKGAVPLYDRLMSDGKIVTYAITFETGKADLKPESMIEINRIAKLMKENPGLEFEVQGHCDATGSDKVNDPLSQKRAEAIVAALVEQDIAEARLTPVGKGSHSPIASNSTDEGRAKNRRVEFVKK